MADSQQDTAELGDVSIEKNEDARDPTDASKKSDSDQLEFGPRATYIPTNDASGLSQEHRDYLLKRHGTLELDPIPSGDPADPYNWPFWKKTANLILVSFHVSCVESRVSYVPRRLSLMRND